jgi:ATP/maltotriose-dependent transcriptional regulator MalT
VSAFERYGDDRALAHAWHLIAWVHMDQGRHGALADAVRRGREHARMAGDAMTEEELTVWALLAGITGPRPAKRLRSEAQTELDEAQRSGRPRVEGAALLVLSTCAAFDDRFEEARELLRAATAIEDELGGRGRAFLYTPAAMIELLAGDLAEAERKLRNGYEALRQQGDAWFLCGVAAELADILWLQGNDDEALELTLLSERAVGEGVLVAQMMWRGARAKILARRGQPAHAERLAREGVELIQQTITSSITPTP